MKRRLQCQSVGQLMEGAQNIASVSELKQAAQTGNNSKGENSFFEKQVNKSILIAFVRIHDDSDERIG